MLHAYSAAVALGFDQAVLCQSQTQSLVQFFGQAQWDRAQGHVKLSALGSVPSCVHGPVRH